LPQDYFSCNKNIFLTARKKLSKEKKILRQVKECWGKKRTVLSLYQKGFS